MSIAGAFRAVPVAALTVSCALATSCGGHRTEGPSVLLFILDSARADHLGCYGYERDTSPTLDSLSEAGTTFLQAQAQAPWTLPAVGTILTGLVPQVHGVGMYDGTLYGLDENVPVIQEIMHDAGYHTFGSFCIAWLGPDFGFDRGFDSLFVRTGRAHEGMIDESTRELTEWLATLPDDEQFFAVVHVFEMHGPFDPPHPYDSLFLDPADTEWTSAISSNANVGNSPGNPDRLGYMISQYDGEIAMADAGIGRLLAMLRRSGRADDTVVIVVSDHGEEFAERGGYAHGHTLYQEMLHVPLIFAGPGIPSGETRPEPVGQFDIVPTILGLAGEREPDVCHGVDLFAGPDPDRVIPSGQPADRLLFCVRSGSMKLVLDPEAGTLEAFDLSADPGETRPLPPDSALVDSLMKYVTMKPAVSRAVEPDEEAADALRDLGYI